MVTEVAKKRAVTEYRDGPLTFDTSKPPQSNEERFHRIAFAFRLEYFPDKADGVLIRATTGEIIEPPKSKRLTVKVDTEYAEGYHCIKAALHLGYYPEHEIDHADRDRRNNRLDNLREATHQENSRNRGPAKRKDPSLPRCVYPARPLKDGTPRWRARVAGGEGRNKSLGYFSSPHEASAAAEAFLRELHGPFYRPPAT